MKVVQVCEWIDGVVDNCTYVPYTSGLLPDLSISDALLLSSAIIGLLTWAYALRKVRKST